MYTANIADAVIFRSLGKSPNPLLDSLQTAVEQADTELWVPASIYRELTDYRSCKAKTPPFRAGIQPTTLMQSTADGKTGYSTPIDTINKTVFITSYEARK